MHRIDSPGATVDNKFTEGNPSQGIPATVLAADWMNAVQEEIVGVVTAAAIAPNKGTITQLRDAILWAIDTRAATLAGKILSASTFTGNTKGTGIVPLGAVIAMASSAAWALPANGAILDGWALCNGQNYPTGSAAGFSGAMPNLSNDRFLQGAASVGGAGGSNALNLSHTHAGNPVTLAASNIPQLTGSFWSGNQSADHTHTFGTGGASADHSHTYSGTVAAEAQEHTHGVSGTTAAELQEHTHSGNTLDDTPDHTHGSGMWGAVGPTNAYCPTTGPRLYNMSTGGASTRHTHPFATGGRSASHNHTFSVTSAGRSTVHYHTYSGTSSGRNVDHSHSGTTAGMNVSHTHTTTVTLGAASPTAFTPSAGAALSSSQDIRPAYFNVVYLMRVA